MNKAVLVLDEMPKNCSKCPMLQYAMEYEDVAYMYCGDTDKVISGDNGAVMSRPTWCPLKPLPKEVNEQDVINLGITNERPYLNGFCDGYKVCLKEILGEEND